jgi:FdhD protein
VKPAAAISEIAIHRVRRANGEEVDDTLAVEEPLEIRLSTIENGKRVHLPISITMRTPGADDELAAGFLFTEGIVTGGKQITDIRHCGKPAPGRELKNTILVELADGVDVELKRLERNFYTTSSCGVCGKSSIDALRTGAKTLGQSDLPKIASETLIRLPELLRSSQNIFDSTGGLHASALFNTDGKLDLVREDVGRHNALDKVIGAKFRTGNVPLSTSILLVSGRASFELVQKALMAGIPILAAVGAPSSLAVELAEEFGMTLVGFVRDGGFNIYTGGQRII